MAAWFVAAPIVVPALGAASYGSVVAFGSASPSPPEVTQQEGAN
jgi:hypothetical protein